MHSIHVAAKLIAFDIDGEWLEFELSALSGTYIRCYYKHRFFNTYLLQYEAVLGKTYFVSLDDEGWLVSIALCEEANA